MGISPILSGDVKKGAIFFIGAIVIWIIATMIFRTWVVWLIDVIYAVYAAYDAYQMAQ